MERESTAVTILITVRIYSKGSETTDFSAVAIPELTRVEVLAVTNSDAGDVTANRPGG